MGLRIVPITQREAFAFVAQYHRHHAEQKRRRAERVNALGSTQWPADPETEPG